MNFNKIVSTACIATLIGGCTQVAKKESVQAEKSLIQTNRVYGELILDDGQYKLSPYIYIQNKPQNSNNPVDKTNPSWRFKIPSFEPAFSTSRRECTRSPKTNGCLTWDNREREFIYVNFTQSDYGNTPEERRKIEKNKLTAGGVAKNVLLSPFYMAAGVGAAAGAAVGVVAMSPILVTAAVLNPDKAMSRDYWIEFHHDQFSLETNKAINKFYKNSDAYIIKSSEALKVYDMMISYNKTSREKLSLNQLDIDDKLSKFYVGGVKPIKFNVSNPEISTKIDLSKDLLNLKVSIIDYLDSYYKKEADKQESFFEEETKKIIAQYKDQESQEFSSAKTSYQWKEFINRYKSNDLQNLVPKAISNMKIALNKEAIEKNRKRQKLLSWRSNLKVGDDTFCGPIIQINKAMIKIAVRAQLQGYGNEAWLKRSETYPQRFGCLNQNGRLSPTM